MGRRGEPTTDETGRLKRRLPGLEWILLLVAVADWVALRQGVAPHPPALLAFLVAAVAAGFLARLAGTAWRLARAANRRLSGVAEMILLLGVLTALGGGMANWLLRLQGFAILHEGLPTPLHGGTHLQSFEAGPLARLAEMEIALTLSELELVPAGGGGFYPRSHLIVQARGEDVRLTVDPRRGARLGALRYFQGAFGFAPRIVILRGDETLFDEAVPFLTELRGESGITFEGSFRVEAADLDVAGTVDLTTLDEGLRGHAGLDLTLRHGDEVLGRGSLLPGHFATLDEGYRVGFTGLEKWSEVDVVRRNYGRVVVVGASGALLGAVFWPLAAWRRW